MAENFLIPHENQQIPENGLGHILAVAAFIDDVDVIGGSGGNIGVEIKIENKKLCAKSIKIDPGFAFTFDEKNYKKTNERSIYVATQGDIQFDKLSNITQKEFLMTLHQIKHTGKATLEGFFTRKGAHNFIKYAGRSAEEFAVLLEQRKKDLIKVYEKDLQQTEKAYIE